MASTTALISTPDFHDYAELKRNGGDDPQCTIGFIAVSDEGVDVKILPHFQSGFVTNFAYNCVPFIKNATSPLTDAELHTQHSMCTRTMPIHYDATMYRFFTIDVDVRFPSSKDAHFLFIHSASLPQPAAHPVLCIHSASNAVYLTDRCYPLIVDTFKKRGIRGVSGVTRFYVIDASPITLDQLQAADDQPALFAFYSRTHPDKITALYTNAPYLERHRAEIELKEEEARVGHESSQKRQKTTALDRLTKKCEKLQKRTKLVDEVDIAKVLVVCVSRVQMLPIEESIRNSRMLLARNAFLQFKESSKIENMRDAHSAMSAALVGYDV